MATFVGTQTKCKVCDKTVYLVDQLIADGYVFHKSCFRYRKGVAVTTCGKKVDFWYCNTKKI